MGQVLSYISNIWRCIHSDSKGHDQLPNSEQQSHYITIPDPIGDGDVDSMTRRAPQIPELESNDQQHYYITIPDGYSDSDGDDNMTWGGPEISVSTENQTVTLPALPVRPSVIVVNLRNVDEAEEAVEVEKEVIVSEVVIAQPLCNVIQRIGPYNSHQTILLVGEGNFSFSASLAVAFGNASNIIATSLNSQEYLIKNYKKFLINKMKLETRGCMVIHGVDATKIVQHSLLGNLRFDCIIYNFPHTGNFGRSDSDLRKNRELVTGFLRNAKRMVNENGEIHITHKSNGFFGRWNIPKIGCGQDLYLNREIRFNRKLYHGYQTKFGFRGDGNFHCSPSKTYVFGTHPK